MLTWSELDRETESRKDEVIRKLSQERAKSVVDYLIEEDVNQTRLSYAGYGSEKPLTTNSTEGGRAINRRVEFLILGN